LLRQDGPGALEFTPELPRKREAANALAMGHVVKIIARFHAPFWPRENVGYIHAPEEFIPTWWSHPSAPLLTGWVGGPRARPIAALGEQAIREEALSSLTRVFAERRQRLEDLLDHVWFHDWSRDPFALGAYSYTPVGQVNTLDLLRKSCADTLFFAGEATAEAAEQGTVSGAISSGLQAAQEVLQHVSNIIT
jgi:monoamine oxidase